MITLLSLKAFIKAWRKLILTSQLRRTQDWVWFIVFFGAMAVISAYGLFCSSQCNYKSISGVDGVAYNGTTEIVIEGLPSTELVSGHGTFVGGVVGRDGVERRLAASFNEHSGQVSAVAFAPDGKCVASASEGRSMILWDFANREEMTLAGHDTRVTWPAFAPDRDWLASVDRDRNVIIRGLAERRPTRVRRDVGKIVHFASHSFINKEIKGEELIELTRGFMYAGAPPVVASLRKVDDQATEVKSANAAKDSPVTSVSSDTNVSVVKTDEGRNTPKSEILFWVSLFSTITNAIGAVSAILLAWISNHRARAELTLKKAEFALKEAEALQKAKEAELKLAQLELELLKARGPQLILTAMR